MSSNFRRILPVVAVVFIAITILGTALSVRAQPAAPTAGYLVTSSADTTLTTCAGGANDCTLRGAVQLANASAGGDFIFFDPSIQSINLSRPITLTGGDILINGNGQEVTNIRADGNFAALVITSSNNTIGNVWISASLFPAGTNQHGVYINGGNGNTIINSSLSRLGGSGVRINNGSNNKVVSSFIGLPTVGGHPWTGCEFGNGAWGIYLFRAAHTSILSNTIGCNAQTGISIFDFESIDNSVQSNYIGVTRTGARIPNTKAGLYIGGGASGNTIGGSARAQGNIIGGNLTYGVWIEDAYDNLVQWNSIGISSTLNISNTLDGLYLRNGSANNRVVDNLIVYNGHNGIQLDTVSHNEITQNSIGYNGYNGVLLINTDNTSIVTNTIAYNSQNGVVLTGGDTAVNALYGNGIGYNTWAGVAVTGGAYSNSIGKQGDRTRGNLISGNLADGVYISGDTTIDNLVYGNQIGTNSTGTAAAPNGFNGVTLDNGANYNVIGLRGTERNIIGGNAGSGVALIGGAHHNWVQGNDIGLNRDKPQAATGDYLAIPNQGDGLVINNAYTNTIGGYMSNTPVGNFINHNARSGVYLTNGAADNLIGLNEVRANQFYGVLLEGGPTTSNVLSRTHIYANGYDGIGERQSANYNVWTEVSVHHNGGLGVDKQASNDALNVMNAPYLFIDSVNPATGVISGRGHSTAAPQVSTQIELYRVAVNAKGFAEGVTFVGRTFTDSAGHWTITDTLPGRACYTAFEALSYPTQLLPYASSEFSANTCRTLLPALLR